jgi:hypothetical protein
MGYSHRVKVEFNRLLACKIASEKGWNIAAASWTAAAAYPMIWGTLSAILKELGRVSERRFV